MARPEVSSATARAAGRPTATASPDSPGSPQLDLLGAARRRSCPPVSSGYRGRRPHGLSYCASGAPSSLRTRTTHGVILKMMQRPGQLDDAEALRIDQPAAVRSRPTRARQPRWAIASGGGGAVAVATAAARQAVRHESVRHESVRHESAAPADERRVEASHGHSTAFAPYPAPTPAGGWLVQAELLPPNTAECHVDSAPIASAGRRCLRRWGEASRARPNHNDGRADRTDEACRWGGTRV